MKFGRKAKHTDHGMENWPGYATCRCTTLWQAEYIGSHMTK